MTTLANYGITITYDKPPASVGVLLRDGEHIQAVNLAMDAVKSLRAKGIMDAIWIRPHDEGNGPVYDVLRVTE